MTIKTKKPAPRAKADGRYFKPQNTAAPEPINSKYLVSHCQFTNNPLVDANTCEAMKTIAHALQQNAMALGELARALHDQRGPMLRIGD